MKKNILILLLSFQIASVYSQQSNVLQKYNGDFETGIDNWRFFEVPNSLGSNYEFTSDAVSGSQAIKINYTTPDGTLQDRGLDNWTAGVPVVAGSEYTLKASVKSDQNSGLKISMVIGFFKSDGSVISPQVAKSHDLNATYTEHTLTAVAPDDAATCWVAFRLINSSNQPTSGIVYIDNVQLLGEVIKLDHRLMETLLPTDDVPIAGINVLEEPYLAKNDGSADATEAFQKAINYTVSAGGGVVFVPAGKYRFDGNLNIPAGVVLRGEWKMFIPYSPSSNVLNALYNLKDDPNEMNNLLGNNPESTKFQNKANELKKYLLWWFEKKKSIHYQSVSERIL